MKATETQVDIPGYEGLYCVTSGGLVISYGGKSNHKKDIILKPAFDKDGYRRVRLQKGGLSTHHRVCRLVAAAFVARPEGMNIVNHIDEDKRNDHYTNLEWTDIYGNWKHSMGHLEQLVIRICKATGEEVTFPSLMEAARQSDVNQGNITNCLKGRCKSVGGYYWKRK